MTHDAEKSAAARAALAFVRPGAVLGVGSGTTVARFIDALGVAAGRPTTAVSTSRDTAQRLERIGVRALDLNEVDGVEVYIDGADEIDPRGRMIKGAGGASTMEKLVASAAKLFICIVDESKVVQRLGARPIPLEVLPAAVRFVQHRIADLGGTAVPRTAVSDLGDPLLDVRGLELSDPDALEHSLEAIPGVVGSGLFAIRRADVALVGHTDGTVEQRDFASG